MTTMNGSAEETYLLDIRKLGVLNYLGEVGISGVESRLGKLAGKPTAVESGAVKNGYVDESNVDLAFPDEKRVGVQVDLNGVPHGCIMVLFSLESANRAVRLMLSDTNEDLSKVSNEMAISTILELGGIVANGFLDALADTFNQHIATWPPEKVVDQVPVIVDGVISDADDCGLYLQTTFHITSHDIEVEVYMFPENDIFVQILDRLDMETVVSGVK